MNNENEECGTLFSSAWLEAIEKIPSANDRLECFLAITRYGCRGEEYEGDSIWAKMMLSMALPMLRKFRAKAIAGKLGGMSGKGLSKARIGNQNASKTQQAEHETQAKRKQNASKTQQGFLHGSENQDFGVCCEFEEQAKNASKTQATYDLQTRLNKGLDSGDGIIKTQAKRKQNATNNKDKDKDKIFIKEKIHKKESPTSPSELDLESSALESEAFPFSDFWTAYPPSKRKADKARCESNWRKLNQADRERCIVAVKAWAQSEDWTKQGGEFIPAPLVFLHQRRWEAEFPKKATPTANAPYRTPNYAEKIAEMRRNGIEVKSFGEI